MNQPFVVGALQTTAGPVPRVSTRLTARDRFGTVKARCGIRRMNYTVEPGLYAVGHPREDSTVLVTANYKMSFDSLRKSLSDRDAWILVLDTKGINVWCAAGKSTFGTEELVARIGSSGLEKVISNRRVILPQLGAPGIAAHLVKKHSGFRVTYGPVRAADLPSFLDSGLKATEEMRRVTFNLAERAVLIPVELVATLKPAAFVLLLFFFLAGLGGPQGYWENALHFGSFAVSAIFSAIFAGAVLTPLLLPWLPGRAFSLKGFGLGLLTGIIVLSLRGFQPGLWPHKLEIAAWLLLIPSVTAYLAMNFTGASTYTSLSGVKKEMRFAVPLQVVAGLVGLTLWIASRLIS